MKKAAIYIRFSSDQGLNSDQQRDELLDKLGETHGIVAEYREDASGKSKNRPGLTKLLEDAAKGEFDILLCTDLTRLSRQLSPEILAALNQAGVRVVTADGGEIGLADLIAHTLSRKTFVEHLSERIRRGKRAARERRKAEADTGSA